MTHPHTMLPDYIFESSWEVCNKTGGIYTVLSTRAKILQKIFPDKIIFIGPDLRCGKENPDFIESKTLLKTWKQYAIEKEKLQIRVGRWNIPGNPIVVLVNFSNYYNSKDIIYYKMWEKFNIDSTVAYGDYDESCMFAYSVGRVIESLYHFLKLQDKNIIAHLNEWMLSMAALYLYDCVPNIATVFTSHATSIGRSISGNNKPLYDQFYHYNGDQMAWELNVIGKHTLEKKAAHYVDCFTTVSEITGKECEQLLEKKPDVITPNGFEPNFVPRSNIFAKKRETARQALIHVSEQLTGIPISNDALFVATSGRYEYHNKGLDIFIEALYRVKQIRHERPIVAFILVPACISGPRTDLQKRLGNSNIPNLPLPNPYYTHELVDNKSDNICNHLNYLDFTNQGKTSVQLIFVPSYLNGDDGIFNMSYYDVLIGFDLTIFPSYYEPWGYTPLESIAFHIPTITTNLAGFGLWVEMMHDSRNNKSEVKDVVVVERTDSNFLDAAETIKNIVIQYLEYSSTTISEIRKAVFALSKKANWSHFIKYYLTAYDIALKKNKLTCFLKK